MNTPDATEALKAELHALEQRLLDPAVRADPARVRAMLTPDFLEFGASGRVFDRDAIVAALASEGPRQPLQMRGFKLRPLGPGTALTLWRVKRDDGIETLRSTIWQQQPDGRWLIAFHQGTVAAQDDEATS